MEYDVKILSFNDIVEEELKVEIDGRELYCFSSFHSPEMKVNHYYKAELELVIFDGLEIQEQNLQEKEICRLEKTFAFVLKGYLQDGELDTGIKFYFDIDDLDGFWHLNNKYVEVKGIDRIDLNFIS